MPSPGKPSRVLYTKAFVAEAIRRYDAEGRDATIAFFNSPESMDGEWYLFIIDEEGLVLAHSAIPEKRRIDCDRNRWELTRTATTLARRCWPRPSREAG